MLPFKIDSGIQIVVSAAILCEFAIACKGLGKADPSLVESATSADCLLQLQMPSVTIRLEAVRSQSLGRAC
jgi:hypothetical protein